MSFDDAVFGPIMSRVEFEEEDLVEEDPEHVVVHRPTYPTLADVDEGLTEDIEERGLASTIDYNAVQTYPQRPTFEAKPLPLRYETQCVAFDPCKSDPNHPSSMPIYQTATFVQPSIERFGPYDYTRSGNPTRTAVEQLLAGLEGAHAAFSFNTGMAALAAITRLCDAGDEIICGDDIYGGMHRLLSRIVKRYGIKVHFVNLSDADAVAEVLNDHTRIVHCESPSNPLMRITDLRRLSAQLKAFSSRIVLSVDSTMMSPYWMQPLRLGADIVVHSATKFLLGHSDTMAGFVCTSTPELSSAIAFVQNAEGTACSPFDCWLILRGLKTLCIRQDRAEENAQKVVAFLANHPIVREVYYASYCPPDASGKRLEAQRIHLGQARSGGAVLSFTTGSVRLSRKICDAVHLFKITVSFGSCNSLIEMPCVLSHASIPAEMRTLPEDLLRLSIGIEHYEDLIADLEQAFHAALPGKDVSRKKSS